ncbi:MAG: hypothetical protein AABX11_02395 [Nanoarchaeota archaeon]
MKSKLIVGISLIIFAVLVINILAIGLLTPSKSILQDYPPINQSSSTSNKSNSTNSINAIAQVTPTPTPDSVVTPSPSPKPTSVPVTRAS